MNIRVFPRLNYSKPHLVLLFGIGAIFMLGKQFKMVDEYMN